MNSKRPGWISCIKEVSSVCKISLFSSLVFWWYGTINRIKLEWSPCWVLFSSSGIPCLWSGVEMKSSYVLCKDQFNAGRAESHACSDWCHHTRETHNMLLLSGLATCTVACLLWASHLCLPFQGQYLANRICSAMVTSKQRLGPLSHLPVSWVISSAYNVVAPFANFREL